MLTSGSVPVLGLRQFKEAFGRISPFLTLVFQRNAWFDSGVLLMRQTTEAFTVHTAENCGNSAVAVLQRRRHFLHGAEADFHGLAVQQTMVIPRLQFLNAVIDVPVVRRGCFLWSRRFVGP